jgi:hypothetical protein
MTFSGTGWTKCVEIHGFPYFKRLLYNSQKCNKSSQTFEMHSRH